MLPNSSGGYLKIFLYCPKYETLISVDVQAEVADLYPNSDPKLVGYHIGMDINFNKSSKIIFMKKGIFLQRFIHEDQNTEGGILKRRLYWMRFMKEISLYILLWLP